MKIIESENELSDLIATNDIIIVYFGSDFCNVCLSIKPKFEEMIKKYPKIEAVEINIQKSAFISAKYNIFTIPAIILFIDGKESLKAARIISLLKLDNEISRYYNLYYSI